jgi:hypothetical protein
MFMFFSLLLVNFQDDYNAARAKLRQAEETSTLETDEDDVDASRQHRRKTFSDDEDDQRQFTIPRKKILFKKHTGLSTELPVPPASLQESAFIALTCSRG